MKIRRRTRETYRRELATVRQSLGTPTAAAVRADIAANKLRAAELRRAANRGGGGHREPEQVLGVVTGTEGAGGARPPGLCAYCRQPLPAHDADCSVIS